MSTAMDGLVSAGLLVPETELELLAGGFIFTEGPIWHQVGGYLLFSDMPGDVRRRWSPAWGVEEALRPANKCNGMTYDADGNLIVCEHATSRLVRVRPDGSVEIIASHYQGHELNSPNDVVVRADGSIYFTDPSYGRAEGFGIPREQDLPFQGVYRVSPSGDLALVVEESEFEMPNGLCFTPGENQLYVNDTPRGEIKIFDIADDGALVNGQLFASGIGGRESATGSPDGMKCDAQGNVWVTGPDGIWVFAPDGNQLGAIEVPEVVGNMNWGGDEWRDLFIAASTSLYRLRTSVGGDRSAYMTDRATPESRRRS